ncbi:uncharacterized protein LOC110714283 [Chenopodium quinoa]|uniref:5'-3' exonuclease domain-containing protein n=1 Tax=Chenopodium quinoa TaxID=63459 RepID=A0A803L049_CHEQI|nr:uncharacterized protein LOC110714283 [Chenopodium quinoa]XP_021748478.1 uncharacterized protein LOC110714283 [Chenopodium quinoa]
MLGTAASILQLHTPLSFPLNNKWSTKSPLKYKKLQVFSSVSSNTQTITEQVSSIPGNLSGKAKTKERVFLLDVNPICYKGSSPSLHSFAHWISLFFSEVSLNHPVIAVLDGEGGHEHRKQILPSYKAHRLKYLRRIYTSKGFEQLPIGRSLKPVIDLLKDCNVPVLKLDGQEADDVIATLAKKVLDRGKRVVIASPDKDFKQLISEDVQLVQPLPELKRWSFYTLKHYIAQYSCDPQSDLSLRCIIGDEVDGVPGIQNLVSGFGRKTALKLIKKHGSLENLLNAAAVRTVGKQYVQEALTKYTFELRRNHQVLSLRRDIDVFLEEEWLSKRDTTNDLVTITNLNNLLRGS